MTRSAVRSIVGFLASVALVATIGTPSAAAATHPVIGPSYWSTGSRGSTVFFTLDSNPVSGPTVRYASDPEVRALVKKQLQDMFDAGATHFTFRLFLSRRPGDSPGPGNYYTNNFPISAAEISALELFLNDVAAIGDVSTGRALKVNLVTSFPYAWGAPGKGGRSGRVDLVDLSTNPVEIETEKPHGLAPGERDIFKFDNLGCVGVAAGVCCGKLGSSAICPFERIDETNVSASDYQQRIVEATCTRWSM